MPFPPPNTKSRKCPKLPCTNAVRGARGKKRILWIALLRVHTIPQGLLIKLHLSFLIDTCQRKSEVIAGSSKPGRAASRQLVPGGMLGRNAGRKILAMFKCFQYLELVFKC
mmetsp:Transcript_50571/g.98892  ORF Transcript_50571/g.98892 Transcript_50571/m.98892 type:complete len:111 (+) Transcript_50571:923-1255(+)